MEKTIKQGIFGITLTHNGILLEKRKK